MLLVSVEPEPERAPGRAAPATSGLRDGCRVGLTDGTSDGCAVGLTDGVGVGSREGLDDG